MLCGSPGLLADMTLYLDRNGFPEGSNATMGAYVIKRHLSRNSPRAGNGPHSANNVVPGASQKCGHDQPRRTRVRDLCCRNRPSVFSSGFNPFRISSPWIQSLAACPATG